MISEKLANLYTHLEDRYFNVLDTLDHRGVPVYAYSDFFEDKGIPSLIVTIAIFVLILALLSLVFVGPTITVDELTLTIKDTSGRSLSGINLSIHNQNGLALVENKLVGDGDIIQLIPQLPATKLTLRASKTGYHDVQEEIMLGEDNAVGALLFRKDFVGIQASVGLNDSETSSKVTNASVTITWDQTEWILNIDSNGVFRNTGIPEDTPVIVKVVAEGYTTIEQPMTFIDGVRIDLTLTPSANAFVGKASVIITVSDDAGTIDGATVTVFNKQTDVELVNDVTIQGAIAAQIQTGIPLRIVVESDGYLTYDSDAEDKSFTLRRAEEKIDVVIAKGGEKLIVNVVNDLGLPLDNAVVQLFYLNGNQLDRKISKANGATFEGLNPDDYLYITAVHQEYLPGRIKIHVGSTEIASLVLQRITNSNSTRIDLYTTDKYATPVSGAQVKVFEIMDSNKPPYGIDETETSTEGYANFIIEKNKTYEITAETETFIGNKLIEIGDVVIDNKVYITMETKPNVVELRLKNPVGGGICGTGKIIALDDTIMYDGNIIGSKIIFNSQAKEVIELNITQCDGNTFIENIYVKGKSLIEVIVYNKDSDLSPAIEFIGLENENGETVQGLTPGAFFWAKFSVKFPLAADTGGVHIRAGQDNIEFADSGNIAIYDLDMVGAENTYSYSYSQNEVVDRGNASFEGEESKWVEGIVQNPDGTYITKVKIRVADFTAGKIPIKYRAWAHVNEEYHRTPFDAELETGLNSDTKSSLYAEVITQEFNLYESLPECNDNICVSMNFVDNEEVFYDTTGFEALVGKVYALEAEFTAKETDYLQVSVSTDNNLNFVGTQNGAFNFVDNLYTQGLQDSTIAISVTKDSTQKVRFYFIGESPGAININFIAAGNAYIEKDLIFNVVDEKKLLIELSNSTVQLGKDFTVKVFDEGLSGVENAFVKVLNKKGEVVKSVVGDSGNNTGMNGIYKIVNNLDAGLYTVEVSAPKYGTQTLPLLVSISAVLSFPENIEVKMQVGQKNSIATEPLMNQSDLSVGDLSYKLSDTDNFIITAVVPPILGTGQTSNVQLNIEYIGSSETLDEEVDLTISGYIESKFLVEATSKVNIIYNKQLDSSCLVFEPNSITMNMIGHAGQDGSEIFEATNNCEQPITLTKRIREKTKNSGVAVDSDDISLQPGQTKNITVRAHNLIERGMRQNENYSYEIIYDSNSLTKRLNVKVILINPNFALSCPGQVTLWMSQNAAGQKATAAQPLYITNGSQFPIENLNFSINGTSNGVKLSIEPSGAVSLGAGEAITPTKVVFAQGNTTLSEPVQQTIVVTGKMGNLNNRSGQRDSYNYYDNYNSGNSNSFSNYSPNTTSYASNTNETLCTIQATVYHSGFDCLEVNVRDDLTFNLGVDGISNSKKIAIQNNCAEPVRIVAATAQANGLQLGVQTVIIPAGQPGETTLSVNALSAGLKLNGYPIFIHGITEISQTPIKSSGLQIDVRTGGDYSIEKSKALTGLTVKECSETGGENQEITIDVPKVSSDCSVGYCDAIQASEYISKKLDVAIRKAESYAYSKQSQTKTFGCETQGYCTFAQVGMKEETFDLYLKNDVVSVGALREALKDTTSNQTSGIRGGLSRGDYRIEMTDVSIETVQFLASSGYNIPTVFIDDDLQGCGYYKVKIDGAFPAAGGFLSFQSPVLLIRAIDLEGQGGLTTPECIDDIANLVNFTPVDAGLTITNNKGTWLTSITAENNLKSLGEKLATEHFKDKSRLTNTSSGNRIKLTEGALSGALAEMCLLGGEQKLIEVKINSNISGMSDTEKEAFQKSLSKMISDGLSGTFGNNCLVKSGDGHNCVRLTEASDVGRLNLDIPDKIMLFSQGGGCVFGDISSPIPESITFKVEGRDNDLHYFEGIKRITIEEVKNSSKISTPSTDKEESILDDAAKELASNNRKYYYEAVFEGTDIKNEISYPIELTRNQNSKDKRFKRDLKICAYPTLDGQADSGESTYVTANGVTFVVNALNKNAGEARGTEDADGTIKINAGTIHPDDLIKLLTAKKATFTEKGENRPYYFTINWNDSALKIEDFEAYYRGMGESGEEIVQTATIETKDGEILPTTATSAVIAKGKKKAIYSYLGSCAATSAVCNAATGVGNQVFGVVADCLIPASTIFRKDLAESSELLTGFYEWAGKIPLIGGMFRLSSAPLPDAKSWNPVENPLIAGGTLGLIERELVLGTQLGVRGGMGIHNTALLSDTANALKPGYKDAAETLITRSFTGLDPSVAAKFSTDYSDFMAKEFQAQFKAGYKAAMDKKNYRELTRIKSKVLPASEVQDVIAKAQTATQNSSKAFFRSPLSKSDPTTYIDYLTSNGGRTTPAATADDIIRQLTNDTPLRGAVSGSNPLNNLDSVINSSVGELSGEVTDVIAVSRAKGSVQGIVDNLTQGLNTSNVDKDKLVKAIQSKMDNLLDGGRRDALTSLTGTPPVTPTPGAGSPVNIYMQGPGTTAAGQKTLANVDEIKLLVRDSVTETLGTRNYDDMFKLTSAQLDEIGTAMTAGLADSIDDVAKLNPADIVSQRGLAKRVGSLFKNGRFWGALARGAACGIASNAVGIHYYQKSMETSNKEIHDIASNLGNFQFEKGQTYKMIIETRTSNDRIDATYEKVDGDLIKEMVTALGNKTDKGIIGKQLTWNQSLNSKKPEERKLSLYLLKDGAGTVISTESLRQRLQDNAFDLKKEEIDEIMDNIRSSTSQTLIHRYAVKNPIKVGKITASIITVAPLIAALGDDFKESDKEKEIEELSSTLKDLTTKLLTNMNDTNDGIISKAVSKKVFDTDPNKADILYKVSLAWGDLFR